MELARERKIEIEDRGEKLAHYFKELRSEDWLEYQRRIGALDGDGEEKNRRTILENYDARIVRVEGYTYEDRDLMEACPDDWREWIPGGHKYLAWIELITGDDFKKNS